jgi:hypothetical protein
MAEPIQPRDDALNLDLLQFDELGRTPLAWRQSDVELFPDLPHGLPAPHAGVSRPEEGREFLRHDFREYA